MNSFFYIVGCLGIGVLNSKKVIVARFYGRIGSHVLREPLADAALRAFTNFDQVSIFCHCNAVDNA